MISAVGIALATLSCGLSKSEVHLIPSGYVGDVFIVWGQASGVPAEREGLASVFRIPPDGILVTQDTPSTGWHVSHYYRSSSENSRTELELEPSSIHNTPENRADATPIVWFPRSVEWQADGCSVKYERYYVGSRAHLISRAPNADELRFQASVRQRKLCGPPGA